MRHGFSQWMAENGIESVVIPVLRGIRVLTDPAGKCADERAMPVPILPSEGDIEASAPSLPQS